MRCETCHGTGWVKRVLRSPVPVFEEPGTWPPVIVEVTAVPAPCSNCGGSGFAHCCEGDQATTGSEAPES